MKKDLGAILHEETEAAEGESEARKPHPKHLLMKCEAALSSQGEQQFPSSPVREQNRSLATNQVLDLLRQWLPKQFHLAEGVGRWIWITFPEPPAEKIRGQLGGRPEGPVRLLLE